LLRKPNVVLAIDTNIVVRLFTADDAEQAKPARDMALRLHKLLQHYAAWRGYPA